VARSPRRRSRHGWNSGPRRSPAPTQVAAGEGARGRTAAQAAGADAGAVAAIAKFEVSTQK
jgi:hypothetical protein